MPPLMKILTSTRRVHVVPESAKTPAKSGGHLRFPQTTSEATLDINDLVKTAKTSSCSRETGRAMTYIKGWVVKQKNLRPLFLVMDHADALPGIRKHAGELILSFASDDKGKDTGKPGSYFKRAGDRMAAIVRVKAAIPELTSYANSVIARKYGAK
jgi:hypothetical protein